MQLGITSIQRNRGPWIAEWVAFHYLVGFRKFYIFPHQCSDNMVRILEKLKSNFDITLFYLDLNLELLQLESYQYSINHFLKEVDWMAFIDGDEYLFPTAQPSIVRALEEFSDKHISALGAYWSCFGSNNHIQEPEGLLIENYKYRAYDGYPNNRHVKSLVRGRDHASLVKIGGNAHIFSTPWGTYDENMRPTTKGLEDYEPTYNTLRINHYVTQSRSFFLNFKKYSGGIFKVGTKPESWWEEHDRNDVLDHSMDTYIRPIRKIIGSIE